jgi:hypothetical protein
VNQEQFDADNANESPAQPCTRHDWWHDFRGNPIRKFFDRIGPAWHRSYQEDTEPTSGSI